MNLRKTSMGVLAGLLLAACGSSGYEKTANGVIVTVNQKQSTDVRKVRLEVMGEKLIHVSATPENEFSSDKSLVIVPQQAKADFTVEEQGDMIALKTSQVCALVSKATGEVKFTDANGTPIVAEDQNGRSFKPVEVDGKKA